MTVAKNREVEVKLRVPDAKALVRVLRRLKAQSRGRVHEMNTLFDTPRGRFRKRGHLLRLRVITPADGPSAPKSRGLRVNGEQRALLTYKGPGLRLRANGAKGGGKRPTSRQRYKVRRELEVSLPDAHPVRAILEAVGLVASFRYEKYRTSYEVPRHPGVKLELDEAPVGTFVELEGSPRAIDGLARRLGYSPKDYITSSYLGLHLDQCRRRGVRAHDMLFARMGAARPSRTGRRAPRESR